MPVGLLALAPAAVAALAAWLSFGIQAVVDDTTRARVGVLPPWWLLAALLVVFVGVVLRRRIPSTRVWPLMLTGLVCLPWLPGPVPPAFLIWYGPMATAVWGVVVLGLVAPEVAALWRLDVLVNPRRAPWLLGLIAFVLFVGGAWSLRSRLPGGDEPHYLIITQSLLSDGDLRIENNHARGDYFRYYIDELKPDYVQRGLDGAIYSIHAPGVSALVAPAFALAGWPGAVVFMSALAAVASVLIWLTTWRLTGGEASAAWLASATFAFTGPGYFHAFTIFPDGAGALCVALALAALVRLELSEDLSLPALAGAGAALALLPWLHTRFAVLAGGFGLILLLRLWRRDDRLRASMSVLAVPAVSAAAWFAFFWLLWGTPNPAAPYGQATQSAWAHLQPAIPGLLFDQQFGLITNAPVYAMACLGFVALARRHLRLAIELATVCALYLVAVGTYRMWWGGHSAPARFLVAMLPALTLPLAVAWTRGTTARRALTLVLLTISVAVVLPRAVVDGGALVYNERDGYDLLLDWINRSVNLPLAFPSLHRDIVRDAWRDIGIWLAAGTVCGAGAIVIATRVGQAWTWMAAAVAVTMMVAASLVWRGPAEIISESASALDLLQRWPARPRGSGWQSSPFGRVDAEGTPRHLPIGSGDRGPRAGRTAAILSAPFVPGGRYEIVISGERPDGRLTLTVGRTTQALDVVDLSSRPAGDTGLLFTLPAQVHSLTIHGDERARATVTRLTLAPRTVGNATGAPRLQARRASRYGDARVFCFDDNVFMEPLGFWTRGSAVAEVFIDVARPGDAPSAPVPAALLLRAGPVPSAIVLSSEEWRQSTSLQPGETAVVALPGGRPDGWPLRLETSTGFRPAQHEAGNKDMRNLGVWVEAAP